MSVDDPPVSGAISSSQFESLMAAISTSNTSLEQKLSEFKNDMKRGQDEATERIIKKAKREKCYAFNKKGNQDQYEFNETIAEVLESAETKIDALSRVSKSSTKSLDEIKKAVKEGQVLIGDRQKVIKVADRSEYGWAVVAEYQADVLAADSDDEKKLSRAEVAAEKKIEKKKKKQKGTWKGKRSAPTSTSALSGVQYPTAVSPGYARVPFTAPRPLFPPSRLVGPCHNCQRMGHLRANCTNPPQLPTASPLGIGKYPFKSVGGEPSIVEEEGLAPSASVEREGHSPFVSGSPPAVCVSGSINFDSETCTGDLVSTRFWEVSEVNTCSVKGRLKERLSYWKSVLRATEPVLKIIENGQF